ncbi:MAG: SAM-dependent methyltransferase, partial [Elusimicrobia bacterium]|nr:SAM-dependent methyltransferase [Elusimicrobiota bacterium]
QRGRAGDYFTSMQVGSLFPAIFADVVRSLRESLGCEQFSLVELGAGGGEFLEGVLAALGPDGRKGLRVWAVERARPAREAIWRRLSRFPKCEAVSSLDDIDWMGGLEGLVFSNEFFDALPFHRLIRRDGAWREIYAGLEKGELCDVEAALSDERLPARCGLDGLNVPDGTEVEARPAVPAVYEDIAARLSRGYIISVDYGSPRAALERAPRTRGTWRCFHEHRLSDGAYAHIGGQDMTADVDFTQLAEAGAAEGFDPKLFCSQGIFLSHAGRAVIEKGLASPEKDNVARQVRQLLHPDAMGERFWCLLQARSTDLPASFSEIPNRTARLLPADPKLKNA